MFIRIYNVFILLALLASSSYATDIQVIAHLDVKETSLTSSQLRRIFSMRQTRWHDNTPIVVVTLPSETSLHKKFTTESLHVFPYQLDLIWNKLTFSGLGVAPQQLKTQRELIKAVQSTPGAIGYIKSNKEVKGVNVIDIKK